MARCRCCEGYFDDSEMLETHRLCPKCDDRYDELKMDEMLNGVDPLRNMDDFKPNIGL